MMRAKYLLVAGIAFSLGSFSASGQLLNKIKQKASQKAEQALDKKLGVGGNQNGPNNQGGQNGEVPEITEVLQTTPVEA